MYIYKVSRLSEQILVVGHEPVWADVHMAGRASPLSLPALLLRVARSTASSMWCSSDEVAAIGWITVWHLSPQPCESQAACAPRDCSCCRAANLAMLKRVLDGFKKSILPSKRVLSIITIIYLLFTYKTTYITQ